MGLTPQHEQLNRALDEPMIGPTLAEFQARLERNPDEQALFERLQAVDDLLRQPPMAVAPPDFAHRVMASIEQGQAQAYAPRRRLRLFFGLGLLGMLVSVPLVLALLVTVVPALVEPGVLAGLVAGLVQIVGTISSCVEGLLLFLGNLIATYPMVPALLLTVIPLAMVWVWLVWFLQNQNRPATIIVPVQTVGSRS